MSQAAEDQVRSFLSLHPIDGYWPGTNPQLAPVGGVSKRHINNLVRCFCPEASDMNDTYIVRLIRYSGLVVNKCNTGFVVEELAESLKHVARA